MKKKDRKLVIKMAKEAARNIPATKIISGCEFVGAKYDAKAVGAIETIAEGLVENAKALGSLASVLRHSNVTVESMLKIDN